MLEKIKSFIGTTAGKIVVGVLACMIFSGIVGLGCYIKGCIAGKQSISSGK